MPWNGKVSWGAGLLLGASVLTLLVLLVLSWFAFLAPVSPFVSQRIVRIEGVLEGPSPHVVTTAEFCFTRENTAEATRIFRRMPNGEGAVEEVIETPPARLHFLKGCNIRSRRVDLPEGLPEGAYLYRLVLRFCNPLGNCDTVWLPEVRVHIDGGHGRHLLRFEELK